MAVKGKTNKEIEIMRASGRILASVFEEISKIVEIGITTKEIDKFVYNYVRKRNAIPSSKGYGNPPYPASTCISVNDEVIHGIPGKRKLKDGDIVSVDITISYNGYNTDCARTFMLGNVGAEAQNLVKTTERAFYNGVSKLKAGVHLGDLSSRIQETVEEAGYSVVKDFSGHGVGVSLHEAPSVPNYGKKGTGIIIPLHATLAVEPMVNIGKHHIKIKNDEWTVITSDGSLSAHYENTVLVLENGVEILTTLSDDNIIKYNLN